MQCDFGECNLSYTCQAKGHHKVGGLQKCPLVCLRIDLFVSIVTVYKEPLTTPFLLPPNYHHHYHHHSHISLPEDTGTQQIPNYYRMLPTTTLLVIATTGAGPTLGLSTKVRDTRQATEHHVLDYRVFGETGCFEKNWGVGTMYVSDLDKCTAFYDPGIKSVNLTDTLDGCSCKSFTLFIKGYPWKGADQMYFVIVTVYTELNCRGEALSLRPGHKCGNVPKEGETWKSYNATCS